MSKAVLYGGLVVMIIMVCFVLSMTIYHTVALFRQRKKIKREMQNHTKENKKEND